MEQGETSENILNEILDLVILKLRKLNPIGYKDRILSRLEDVPSKLENKQNDEKFKFIIDFTDKEKENFVIEFFKRLFSHDFFPEYPVTNEKDFYNGFLGNEPQKKKVRWLSVTELVFIFMQLWGRVIEVVEDNKYTPLIKYFAKWNGSALKSKSLKSTLHKIKKGIDNLPKDRKNLIIDMINDCLPKAYRITS